MHLTLAAFSLLAFMVAPEPDARWLRRESHGTPYRLLVPDPYKAGKQYPLVLFLHGGAGRGRDNERQLTEGNGMLARHFVRQDFPAFVLAPQTASTHDSKTTLAILDDVMRRYRVDGTRVYVVGQSLGGYGAIGLIAARPRLFAGAIIVAAGGDTAVAPRLAAVPIWFFHGEKDQVVSVEQPRRLIAAIRRKGGSVKYTEYKGEEHGLAWLVVREREVVPWLFGLVRTP